MMRCETCIHANTIKSIVGDLKKQNADLASELIKECEEHQAAMQIADKRIKELEAQLKTLQENEKVFSRNFAIERLEDVKAFAEDDGGANGCGYLARHIRTMLYIDALIEELKGGE